MSLRIEVVNKRTSKQQKGLTNPNKNNNKTETVKKDKQTGNKRNNRKGGCGCLDGGVDESKLPKDLVEALSENKDQFSTLIDLAARVDLVNALKEKKLTLFAPVNDAFDKLFAKNPTLKQKLLDDPEQLKAVLLAHVVPSTVSPNALDFQNLATLQPNTYLSLGSELKQFSSGLHVNGYPARSESIVTQNQCVLFAMDDVLVPQSPAEKTARAGGNRGSEMKETNDTLRRSLRLQKKPAPSASTGLGHQVMDKKVQHQQQQPKKRQSRKGGALDSDLTEFAKLFNKLPAKLQAFVLNDENVTVMAPSNAAIAKFVEKQGVPDDKQIEALLRAHILPVRLPASYLLSVFEKVPKTQTGLDVSTSLVNQLARIMKYKDNILFGNTTVTKTDLQLEVAGVVGKCIVHVIDDVFPVYGSLTSIDL